MSTAASRFSPAAMCTVVFMPNAASSTLAASTAPSAAPRVFTNYSQLTLLPTFFMDLT